MWQRTPNSSLDPRNADGPIPFTSAAFLALAFARLHINLGPHRLLRRRDTALTAKALLSTPIPRCSPEIIPALLHAAHALNVPVMMGVDYVSGSQMFLWSYQHSLHIADEKGVVSWVRFSVSETLQSVGAGALGLSDDVDIAGLSFPKLGVLVLKIWARIFSDDTMLAFTHEIGDSLRLLADMVDCAD
nr:hypothetical protein CFP56_33430 [Quercus suber]